MGYDPAEKIGSGVGIVVEKTEDISSRLTGSPVPLHARLLPLGNDDLH